MTRLPHPTEELPTVLPRLPRRTPTGTALAVLMTAVLAFASLHLVSASRGAATAAAAPRTWVVDAVDDGEGNRWEAEATGGPDLTIMVGDTVQWQAVRGRAGQGHDLTSTNDGTPWDPPVLETLAPGGDRETFSYTFTKPGTYTYICATHETAPMIGSITVQTEAPTQNRAPTVDAMVSLSSDSAPTTAGFMAHASDADSDALTYDWDFGDPASTTDRATTAAPEYVYRAPGTYTASVRVSDGRATTVDELEVTVNAAAEPPPPVDTDLAVTASATVSDSTPRGVTFAAEVTGGSTFTSAGQVRPFADGATTYSRLGGTATLERRAASTYTTLDVTGLRPNASHLVHVHEQACSVDNGGAHFRFDTAEPFEEANEIWLPFTSDSTGRSGRLQKVSAQRAGAQAVSIVIHDPDNSARRIGCVDLVRGTSTATLEWAFGDGTTGSGPSPQHVYALDGRYTATVRASNGIDGPVSDSVDVVVAGGAPVAPAPVPTTPGTTTPITTAPAAPSVGPAATTRVKIRATRPSRVTRDRTPTVRARVVARRGAVARRDVVLRVDGARVAAVRYAARTGRVSWTPRQALAPGMHAVRLVARDAVGNRTVEKWRFRVR